MQLCAKSLDQGAKTANGGACLSGEPKLKGIMILDDLPKRKIALPCQDGHFLHTGLPDSPVRVINNPSQGFFIRRIHCQTEIGQHILDLLPAIKGQTSIDTVRDI